MTTDDKKRTPQHGDRLELGTFNFTGPDRSNNAAALRLEQIAESIYKKCCQESLRVKSMRVQVEGSRHLLKLTFEPTALEGSLIFHNPTIVGDDSFITHFSGSGSAQPGGETPPPPGKTKSTAGTAVAQEGEQKSRSPEAGSPSHGEVGRG